MKFPIHEVYLSEGSALASGYLIALMKHLEHIEHIDIGDHRGYIFWVFFGKFQ